jgi:hypothetical protein
VSGYLSRARAAGVSWRLAADLDDVQLEALLSPPPPAIAADQRPMPDWAWVHRELRRPNVTLALLWEEYRAGAPAGFGYSWFCDLYRGWAYLFFNGRCEEAADFYRRTIGAEECRRLRMVRPCNSPCLPRRA